MRARRPKREKRELKLRAFRDAMRDIFASEGQVEIELGCGDARGWRVPEAGLLN